MKRHSQTDPVVTVIIPCYNHAHYLPEALESVLLQNYPAVEVIVVDDGSTDHTCDVVAQYTSVKYVYQSNQGLSAARNTGIRQSSGDYIIFLDADDWLFKDALTTNLSYLQAHPEMAFVSGAYKNVSENNQLISEQKVEIPTLHHLHFLSDNYIGMVAAVLFQRWALEEFPFDESLRACEDYDVYLQISRKYPVMHHTACIAAYRRHVSNMSGNAPLMISSMLQVAKRHRPLLRTAQERAIYSKTYHALYEQIFCVKGKVPEEYLRIFKEDRFTFLYQYISDEGKVPKDAFKELGNGGIDMKAVIAAARKAGVAQCHVEQDQSPDPIASIGASMKHLEAIGG